MLAAAALIAGALPAVALGAGPAGAAESQGGADMVVISPGGGKIGTGADGLQIILNGTEDYLGVDGEDAESVPTTASDQVYFANTSQWCCTGAGPQLNIGGTLYGEAGASAYFEEEEEGGIESVTPAQTVVPSFTSTEIVSTSGAIGRAPAGSTSLDNSSATGSGSATIRYTVDRNGLTYVLERTVTYVYPNNYYFDTYTITIPAGNTEVVKYYHGGDVAPGSNDNGKAFGVGPAFGTSAPLNAGFEVNPDSQIFIAYTETVGGGTMNGLYIANYDEPVYEQILNGQDIGFVTDIEEHDAGLDLQWTVGSTPGTYSFTQRTIVGFQGAGVEGLFAENEIASGASTQLELNVSSTAFEAVTGTGFVAQVPAGLTVVGDVTSSCEGGTATLSGSTITLTGYNVAAASFCTVSVTVTGPDGVYEFDNQSISTTGLLKGFSISPLKIGTGVAPAFTG